MTEPRSSTDRITIDLPADPRHAATARVVVASLAADAGFSVDEIDDLRLALNESVALLVDDDLDGGGSVAMIGGDRIERIEVELHVEPGRMQVEVRRVASSAVPVLDDLADRILTAVVDSHVVGPGVVRLQKAALDTAAPSGR